MFFTKEKKQENPSYVSVNTLTRGRTLAPGATIVQRKNTAESIREQGTEETIQLQPDKNPSALEGEAGWVGGTFNFSAKN